VKGRCRLGGNWFFLTGHKPCELELRNIEELTDFTWRIRQALARSTLRSITSNWSPLPPRPMPGTSSSARQSLRPLALRHRHQRQARLSLCDGKLREGEIWRQESIIGSIFEGSFTLNDGHLLPAHQRLCLRDRRDHAIPAAWRSIPVGYSRLTDVVIAGGGIVGAACASEFAVPACPWRWWNRK